MGFTSIGGKDWNEVNLFMISLLMSSEFYILWKKSTTYIPDKSPYQTGLYLSIYLLQFWGLSLHHSMSSWKSGPLRMRTASQHIHISSHTAEAKGALLKRELNEWMNDEWEGETDIMIRAKLLESNKTGIKSLLHHSRVTWSWTSSQVSSSETHQALGLAYIQH